MTVSIHGVRKYGLMMLVVSLFFLLVSCDNNLLKKSALETTGGNGAGLSGYQITPNP